MARKNGTYSVAIGNSTDMERHPAPDETCGHAHRTIAAAKACQDKLLCWSKDRRQCSAKWYNSYRVCADASANSGYVRV